MTSSTCNVSENQDTSENCATPSDTVETDKVNKDSGEVIVTNSVSIDVTTPKIDKNGDSVPPCDPSSNTTANSTSKNMFKKYFSRKTKGMSRSKVAILCIFPFVEFFAATVVSIQGPFYPRVARSKGATPIESGLVFGSFELLVFIMAPIYGAKMGTFNPNRVFNYGIFTTSLSCIAFGFVDYLTDRTAFVLVSLILRSIEAIGDAAFVVASFSIIAAEFPDSVATTFALMETFYGVGLIAGPTLGGGLFKIGGFTLPFLVMGVLLFISAAATYVFITKEFSTDTEKVISSSSFDMFKLLKIPVIAITAFGTFAAATGIGFLNNNLEHHLAQFGVDVWDVGCIFMLNGGVYALTAPIWGKLCDKTKDPKIYSLIGAILTITGFSLAGPLPFFPDWKPSILLVCIGLVIFGLGLGSTLVSAFIQFLQDAISNGYPEDVRTHGLVSGLWTSMTAIGFFVGPSIGGVLDQLVGFRCGTLFIIFEQIVLIGLLTWYFRQERPSHKSQEAKKAEDNLDDVVITYAIKFDTPKPKKNKAKAVEANSSDSTSVSANKISQQESSDLNSNPEKPGNEKDASGKDNPTFAEE